MKSKKLVLRKMIVAKLDAREMERIAGGYSYWCYNSNDHHSCYQVGCEGCSDATCQDTSCSYIIPV